MNIITMLINLISTILPSLFAEIRERLAARKQLRDARLRSDDNLYAEVEDGEPVFKPWILYVDDVVHSFYSSVGEAREVRDTLRNEGKTASIYHGTLPYEVARIKKNPKLPEGQRIITAKPVPFRKRAYLAYFIKVKPEADIVELMNIINELNDIRKNIAKSKRFGRSNQLVAELNMLEKHPSLDALKQIKQAIVSKADNGLVFYDDIIDAIEEALKVCVYICETRTNAPYKVHLSETVRMVESAMADMLGINYDDPAPQSKVFSVRHDDFLEPILELKEQDKNGKELHQNHRINELQKRIVAAVTQRLARSGIQTDDGLHLVMYTSPSAYLKADKAICLEKNAYVENRFKLNLYRSLPDWNGKYNGNEYLKVRSVATSGSKDCREIVDGCDLCAKDVVIIKEKEFDILLNNVMSVDMKTGKRTRHVQKLLKKLVVADGQLTLIEWDNKPTKWLPDSAQVRVCADGKGFMVRISEAMAKSVMKIFGMDPDKLHDLTVIDAWGTKRKLANYCIVATTAVIKGWKTFSNLEDWQESMEKAGVDGIRIINWASKHTSSEVRKVARQFMQQLYTMDDEQIVKLLGKKAEKLALDKTVPMTVLSSAGYRLNKNEDGKIVIQSVDEGENARALNRAEQVFRAHPDAVGIPELYDQFRISWRAKLARLCSAPTMPESIYPFIAVDWRAFFAVYCLDKTPEEVMANKEMLQNGEVSIPCAKEGQKVACGRYPMNFLCATVLRNRNIEGAGYCGAVAFLPLHPEAITRMDGDFDGDEMFATMSKTVVTILETVIKIVNPPIVEFDHGSAPKFNMRKTAAEVQDDMTTVMYNGHKYNEVGRWSNLCTKILAQLRPWMTREQVNEILEDASICHVLAILCVDAVKTGTIPKAMLEAGEALQLDYKGQMPWNQRFLKHSDVSTSKGKMPYDAKDVDGITDITGACEEPDLNVCDRIAYYVYTVAGDYDADFSSLDGEWRWLFSTEEKYCSQVPNLNMKAIAGMLSQGIDEEMTSEYMNQVIAKLGSDAPMSFFTIIALARRVIASIGVDGGDEAAETKEKFILTFRAELVNAVLKLREETLANNKSFTWINRMPMTNGKPDRNEIIRWLGNAALRNLMMNEKCEGVGDKGRALMSLFEIFGDVYAENAHENHERGFVETGMWVAKFLIKGENGKNICRYGTAKKEIEAKQMLADALSKLDPEQLEYAKQTAKIEPVLKYAKNLLTLGNFDSIPNAMLNVLPVDITEDTEEIVYVEDHDEDGFHPDYDPDDDPNGPGSGNTRGGSYDVSIDSNEEPPMAVMTEYDMPSSYNDLVEIPSAPAERQEPKVVPEKEPCAVEAEVSSVPVVNSDAKAYTISWNGNTMTFSSLDDLVAFAKAMAEAK